VKKYSQAKEFLITIGKSKSSLHGLTSSDFSPTTDTWQWLLLFQHFKCAFCILGIFSKTGKTRVSHRVRMMTRWPNDPVPCGVNRRCQAKRAKYWKFYFIETTASILTKFDITIETTRWSSWMVPVSAQQIQDGADGRHFEKNRDIATCLRPFDQFWWNLAGWHILTPGIGSTVKILNFWKSNMTAAAILKNHKNHDI